MKKPNDAAQAILDGIAARAAAHKVRPAEARAELKECRFCGKLYLEPCDNREKSLACGNTKLGLSVAWSSRTLPLWNAPK